MTPLEYAAGRILYELMIGGGVVLALVVLLVVVTIMEHKK